MPKRAARSGGVNWVSPRLSAVGLLALSACCRGPSVQEVSPAVKFETSGGQPLSSLVFPVTAFGATASQSFTVASVSTVDARVTSLSLSGPQAALFSVSPAAPQTIPASSAKGFTVTFAPTLPNPIPAGDVAEQATLTLATDDPAHPTIAVALAGKAAAPTVDLCWAETPTTQRCLSQGPVTVALGQVPPNGVSPPQEIDLVDRADVPLTVTALALDAAARAAGFSIVEPVNGPLTLSAAQGLSLAFHVTLAPKKSGALAGTLSVTSDDPRWSSSAPPAIALAGSGEAPGKPTACLGVLEIGYAAGQSVGPPQLDPTKPLSAQPSILPPGPLDRVLLTAEPSPGCSSDPQDGQNLAYAFALAGPAGSSAQLAPVSGHPEQRSLLFDVAGLYTVQLSATDSAGLSAGAQAAFPVQPHDDLSAELTWQSPVPVDLDLHLVRVENPDAGPAPQSLVGDPAQDCFYCDCLPAADYGTGSSPCLVSPGQPYPTLVDWGQKDALGARDFDDPLLAAQFGAAPLPSEPLDVVSLTGPEAGADYELYVHYYAPSQGEADAGCQTSSDCAIPYPACLNGECVPQATASIRTFVGGAEIDGGSPLGAILTSPCQLWHVGTIHWIGGGHLAADGGSLPPQFTFSPSGSMGSYGSPGSALTCETP